MHGYLKSAIQKSSILLRASSGAAVLTIGLKLIQVFRNLQFTPGLANKFQKFLLGTGPFPQSALLQVEVALDPLLAGRRLGITFPTAFVQRRPNAAQKTPIGYAFGVCGITFSLIFDLGRPGGLQWGKVTSIAEPPHPLLLTDVRMSEISAGHEALESTAVPKGRLARNR